MIKDTGPKFNEGIIGHQLLQLATLRANKLRESYSLKMKPFFDHYGTEAVKHDYSEVLRKNKITRSERLKGYQSQEKQVADVFEMLFLEAADQESWLGNSELTKASEYDDKFNGVDMLATLFDEEERAAHLELSTDLTFGTVASEKKLERILSDIENGKLAHVKYFHCDHNGYTGSLQDVPRTVIGFDRKNLPEFIRARVHETQDVDTHRDIALYQLWVQLRMFRDYADNKLGEHRVRRNYNRTFIHIEKIVKSMGIDPNELPDDQITENIVSMSHSINR
ncbi:hypothetical protein N9L26_00890 [Candidatus Pacebacteria bacterium]|nr:hypothetical protein [Candidatus Paceibacterota bacterium]